MVSSGTCARSTPSAWNWNVAVQREMGYNTTVEVAYVGRVGTHLERTREINALQPGTRQANPGINTDFLRPFKGFAFINLGENAARSEYKGLQIEVNRRFSRGLSYGLAYTYATNNDNSDHRRDQMFNPFDDRGFWGPSDSDTRHVAVINAIYELPILRRNTGLAGKLLGGWEVSAVVQFQTGRPRFIGRNSDYAGIGSGNQFQPWEMNGDPNLPRGERGFSEGGSDDFWWRTTNSDGKPIFAATC